jgi:hypothetical protein
MATDPVPLTVRLAPHVHERLSKAAAGNRRSLNAEVTERLVQSLAPARDGVDRAFQALELPRTVRFEESSTSQAVYALLTVCRELGADAITVAAREDRLNRAVLVVVVQTPVLVAVMDTNHLNMARDPRIAEVETVFAALDGMGLLETALACKRYVPDTSAMNPVEAVDAILKAGDPGPLDLRKFLDLLSKHSLFEIGRFRAGG